MKKCGGGGRGGGGELFEPKTDYVFKKEKDKKSIKKTEPGLEPTTSGFEIH